MSFNTQSVAIIPVVGLSFNICDCSYPDCGLATYPRPIIGLSFWSTVTPAGSNPVPVALGTYQPLFHCNVNVLEYFHNLTAVSVPSDLISVP